MLASKKSQRGRQTMRPDTILNQSATGRQATPVHSIITGIQASKTRHVQAINPAFLQDHTISRCTPRVHIHHIPHPFFIHFNISTDSRSIVHWVVNPISNWYPWPQYDIKSIIHILWKFWWQIWNLTLEWCSVRLQIYLGIFEQSQASGAFIRANSALGTLQYFFGRELLDGWPT